MLGYVTARILSQLLNGSQKFSFDDNISAFWFFFFFFFLEYKLANVTTSFIITV